EYEQGTALRVLAQQLPRRQRQPVKGASHILRHRADEDSDRRRQHQRPTVSSSRLSASLENPGGTRTVTPLGSTSSNKLVTGDVDGLSRGLAVTSTHCGAGIDGAADVCPARRCSARRRQLQRNRALESIPTSAPNSRALNPLSRQRSTRLIHTSRFSRAIAKTNTAARFRRHDAFRRTVSYLPP